MGAREPSRRDGSGAPRWGIVYGSAALVLIAGVRILVDLLDYRASCPFYTWTGVPCPTCFGLRSLSALARGDVAGAIRAHPLLALASLALIAWGAADAALLLARRRPPLLSGPGAGRALRWVLPLAIAANWIYLARRR